MADGQIRIEIAFEGGQALGAFVAIEAADALDRALAGDGPPALTLDATEGRYTVAVQKIVYVKRFARESRVGFGAQ